MNGLKLVLDGKGGIELTDEVISGIDCVRQNGIVNLLTVKGSDKFFPSKGTTLLVSQVNGTIYDPTSAQHQSNFAALDTVTFLRLHEYDSEAGETIDTLQVVLLAMSPNTIKFHAFFSFTNGQSDSTETAA
jgi:hypothetical protein